MVRSRSLTLALVLVVLATAVLPRDSALAQGSGGATLTVHRGTVAVVRTDGSAVQPAPTGTQVGQGDQIRSLGPGGSSIGFLDRVEIDLDPGTILVVGKVSEESNRVQVLLAQVTGASVSRVQPLPSPDSMFAMINANGLAVIQGGTLAIRGPESTPVGTFSAIVCIECSQRSFLTDISEHLQPRTSATFAPAVADEPAAGVMYRTPQLMLPRAPAGAAAAFGPGAAMGAAQPVPGSVISLAGNVGYTYPSSITVETFLRSSLFPAGSLSDDLMYVGDNFFAPLFALLQMILGILTNPPTAPAATTGDASKTFTAIGVSASANAANQAASGITSAAQSAQGGQSPGTVASGNMATNTDKDDGKLRQLRDAIQNARDNLQNQSPSGRAVSFHTVGEIRLLAESARLGLQTLDLLAIIEGGAVSPEPISLRLGFRPSPTSGATAGDDYTASGIEIVIPPGATSGTVRVQVLGDAILEGTESFVVEVASVTNATLVGTQQLTISILDDPSSVTPRGTALNLSCDPAPAPPTFQCVALVTPSDGAAPRPTGRVRFTVTSGGGVFLDPPPAGECELVAAASGNGSSCNVAFFLLTFNATVRAEYDPQGALFVTSVGSDIAGN